jgi:hypothetical protein
VIKFKIEKIKNGYLVSYKYRITNDYGLYIDSELYKKFFKDKDDIKEFVTFALKEKEDFEEKEKEKPNE